MRLTPPKFANKAAAICRVSAALIRLASRTCPTTIGITLVTILNQIDTGRDLTNILGTYLTFAIVNIIARCSGSASDAGTTTIKACFVPIGHTIVAVGQGTKSLAAHAI